MFLELVSNLKLHMFTYLPVDVTSHLIVLLLLLLSLSLSPLYRIFTRMSPRQTLSLGDTLLQLLFRFIVNTRYVANLPRPYVGSDGLLRQHFPENVCSA